ncbi:hypothetical protein JCM8208_007315 [Rhodotorula glutinis]
MTSHAQGATTSAGGAQSRRRSHGQRRLVPEGEGESSREASAESNDETPSGPDLDLDDDDTDRSSAPDAGARGLNVPLEGMRLGSPGQGPLGTPKAGPPGSLAGVQQQVSGEGYDSAGHDGDISSATAASRNPASAARLASHPHAFRAPVALGAQAHPHPGGASAQQQQQLLHQQASYRSSASDLAGDERGMTSSPSPPATETETEDADVEAQEEEEGEEEETPAPETAVESRHPGVQGQGEKDGEVMWAPAPSGFLSNLTATEIQDHIRIAIAGDPRRPYKINPPPEGRPVRIYADGVYDLLHYGHMLQLRQCKLMFPSVHLLVGVCSSSLVRAHKSHPVLSSQERYESVRHVRWVDEVVENAPWQVDQDFIDKWQIDYIAHDEEPYASAGKEDVYAYAKSIGAFLPTKRTNGVSTSELLQRIVEGYRDGEYDGKLRKIGHPELCSRQGSEVGTQYGGAAP